MLLGLSIPGEIELHGISTVGHKPDRPDRQLYRTGRLRWHPALLGPDGADPGLWDVELFEQVDGVAIGHAGEKIPGGDVQALGLEDAGVEELGGPLAQLLP